MTQVSTQPLLDITDLEHLDLQTVSENGQRFYTDTKAVSYTHLTLPTKA